MKSLTQLLILILFISCGNSVSPEEIKKEVDSIKNNTEISQYLPPQFLEREENKIAINAESYKTVEAFTSQIASIQSVPVSENKGIEVQQAFESMMESSSSIGGDEEGLFMDFIMPMNELKDQLVHSMDQELFEANKEKLNEYLGNFFLFFVLEKED